MPLVGAQIVGHVARGKDARVDEAARGPLVGRARQARLHIGQRGGVALVGRLQAQNGIVRNGNLLGARDGRVGVARGDDAANIGDEGGLGRGHPERGQSLCGKVVGRVLHAQRLDHFGHTHRRVAANGDAQPGLIAPVGQLFADAHPVVGHDRQRQRLRIHQHGRVAIALLRRRHAQQDAARIVLARLARGPGPKLLVEHKTKPKGGRGRHQGLARALSLAIGRRELFGKTGGYFHLLGRSGHLLHLLSQIGGNLCLGGRQPHARLKRQNAARDARGVRSARRVRVALDHGHHALRKLLRLLVAEAFQARRLGNLFRNSRNETVLARGKPKAGQRPRNAQAGALGLHRGGRKLARVERRRATFVLGAHHTHLDGIRVILPRHNRGRFRVAPAHKGGGQRLSALDGILIGNVFDDEVFRHFHLLERLVPQCFFGRLARALLASGHERVQHVVVRAAQGVKPPRQQAVRIARRGRDTALGPPLALLR